MVTCIGSHDCQVATRVNHFFHLPQMQVVGIATATAESQRLGLLKNGAPLGCTQRLFLVDKYERFGYIVYIYMTYVYIYNYIYIYICSDTHTHTMHPHPIDLPLCPHSSSATQPTIVMSVYVPDKPHTKHHQKPVRC